MTPRVRFAPSPTGFLHVGGARTALFNWLFARSTGGSLIVRSDDTDRQRSTEEYARDILDSLRWLGLDWDEGIEVGGPHAPYHQSERFARYREVAAALMSRGAAYHSFATEEELASLRDESRRSGTSPAYDGRFETDSAQAAARIEGGEKPTVRFKVPRPGKTMFPDRVRGEVTFDHDSVDDFVILRSDGTPTYHLASTVDDVDFGITHVVRGEDLLSSTPKHILLTKALGAEPATYAHLSLLMGPDGKKLSKRHGDTALSAYRKAGYLPSAMINYLGLLGWSPGDDMTIVTLDDMVELFSLAAVSRNPAVFDPAKLEWMNGVYVRELDLDAFVDLTLGDVEADLGRALSESELATFRAIAPLVQERARLLTDVAAQVRFLFVDDIAYDEASWQKVMTKPEAATALDGAVAALGGDWTVDAIERGLRNMLEANGLSARKGLQPIRIAVSGSTVSPPLFESLEALGRDRSLARIGAARAKL